MKKENLETAAIVYQITCTATGKCYIGVTSKALETRLKEHFKEARSKRFDTVFYRAIRKYGPVTFVAEIVEKAESGLVAQLIERRLILERGTLAPHGLNTSTGGENHAGVQRSDEVREKISRAKIGRRASDEARRRMSENRKGRKASEAQLAGLRAHNADPAAREANGQRARERWKDPEYAVRQKNILTAAARTPEAIARKLAGIQRAKEEGKFRWRAKKERPPSRSKRDAMLERWQNPEYRARMTAVRKNAEFGEERKEMLRGLAASQRGVPLSAEHREKIAAALRGKKRGPYKINRGTLHVRALLRGLDVTEHARQGEIA